MSTAELAILVTGVVGLGSPTIAAGAQAFVSARVAKRERKSKDLDELRGLLDEIVAELHQHTNKLVDLERWMQHSAFHLPSRSTTAPTTEPTRERLKLLSARLIIRRGRDDLLLVRRLDSYLEAVDASVQQIDQLWSESEPFDLDDNELEQRADAYWNLYAAFVDASKVVAGSNY